MSKTLGQIGYEAYCEHTGGRCPVRGSDLPPWGDVEVEEALAWEFAAKTVCSEMPDLKGGAK